MNSILKKQQLYGAQNAIVDYIFCELFTFLVKCYFVLICCIECITCICIHLSFFATYRSVLYHSLQGISVYAYVLLLICYFNMK